RGLAPVRGNRLAGCSSIAGFTRGSGRRTRSLCWGRCSGGIAACCAVVVGAGGRLLRRLRCAGGSGAFLLRGLARCGGIGTGTVGVATRLNSLRGLTRRRGRDLATLFTQEQRKIQAIGRAALAAAGSVDGAEGAGNRADELGCIHSKPVNVDEGYGDTDWRQFRRWHAVRAWPRARPAVAFGDSAELRKRPAFAFLPAIAGGRRPSGFHFARR